jgi:hypothetical protein
MKAKTPMDIKPTVLSVDEELLQKWSTRFEEARNNQTQLFEAFSRWYDNFNAVQSQKVAPWRSKVVDPKVASKALSIIAKLSLNDIEPNLHPNDKHDFIKAKNNEELLNHDLHNPNFDTPIDQKKYSALTDAVVTGTGIALTPWNIKNRKFYTRVVKDGKVDLANEKIKETKVAYNEFIPWSIFRVFIEPNATSLYKANYVIFQDFKTLEELKEGDVFGNYKGLEDLDGQLSGSNTELYERSRNRFMSANLNTVSTYKDKIELWHCYDRNTDTMITIANGAKIIRRQPPNFYWHGKVPATAFYIRPRAHDFWGDSIFQRTERLSSANDSIINHFLDQLDLSLNGVILRRQGVNVRYDMSPGGEVVWDGIEKPEAWAVPQPDMAGFQTARNTMSEAIEENTLSNYETGIPRSNTDKTKGTATGINQITDAASDMIRFFNKTYANSWKQVFTFWMSNNQQFLDRDVAVRILGPNGYYPKTISPEDIVTIGSLDIDIDTDFEQPKTKEAQMQRTMAWIDRQLMIEKQSREAGMPVKVNFYELSRINAEEFGQKNYERVIEPISYTQDSPTEENNLMLQGKETEPQEAEDHATHIQIHQELLDDKGVDKEIQEEIVLPHIMVHEKFMELAKKQVEADLSSMGDPNQLTNPNNGVTNDPGQMALPNQTPQQPPQTPQPQPTTGQQAGMAQPPQLPGQARI